MRFQFGVITVVSRDSGLWLEMGGTISSTTRLKYKDAIESVMKTSHMSSITPLSFVSSKISKLASGVTWRERLDTIPTPKEYI